MVLPGHLAQHQHPPLRWELIAAGQITAALWDSQCCTRPRARYNRNRAVPFAAHCEKEDQMESDAKKQ